MKYIIDLIFKIIGTTLLSLLLTILTFTAFMFWDVKYLKIAKYVNDEIMNLIWKGKTK